MQWLMWMGPSNIEEEIFLVIIDDGDNSSCIAGNNVTILCTVHAQVLRVYLENGC